jgi:hypothetical protein
MLKLYPKYCIGEIMPNISPATIQWPLVPFPCVVATPQLGRENLALVPIFNFNAKSGKCNLEH